MPDRLRRLRAGLRLAAGRVALPGGHPRAPSLTEGAGEPTDAAVTSDGAEFEDRLVWILGSPRTGSSWLLEMLVYPWVLTRKSPTGLRKVPGRWSAQAPSIVPVDESYLLNHLAPMHVPAGIAERPATHADPAEFIFNTARESDPAYFFASDYASAWRAPLRELILARFRAVADLAQSRHGMRDPVVVVKEPQGSHAAVLISSLLPRSRLVFLVRDGRDVIDSLVAARTPGSWNRDASGVDLSDPAQRSAYIRREALVWSNRMRAMQQAHGSHDPARRLMLRYEDLLAEPADQLGRLLDWLGVPRGADHLDATVADLAFDAMPKSQTGPRRRRRAGRPGLWRENFSEPERELMEEIMGPMLRELGYAD